MGAKEGRYPFQGTESVPVYVLLATPEQMPRERLPFAHALKSPAEFWAELERVLGRKLERRFDPQRVAQRTPNFYVYAVEGTTFNLVVHLHGDYPFAQKLGPGYSKLAVSNSPNPRLSIWKYSELMQHPPFVEASEQKLAKPEFFASTRSKQQ